MNSSVTPTLLSPSSPEQPISLLGDKSLDIQDKIQLDSHHFHHRTTSQRDHSDGIVNHDNDSKISVIKTEYKSNFTPFDQYVYNEVTDSFVKQSKIVSNNLLVETTKPLSSSDSNQDLSSERHVTNAVSPALEAGVFEPVGASEAGSCLNSANEPWYMEVTKRNKKANEYRLKSELGHSSALMVEPDFIRKSPLGNDPLIEAQIQDKQQQLQPIHKFSRHEYKRDHLIAHMANNNNFKPTKENTGHSSTSRKVVISSTGTSRPLSRTTAASRARSQSSKRPSNSVPLDSGTLTKSNQTTPTKTVPSRTPTTAIKTNSRPIVSNPKTTRTPTNGVSRQTTVATTRQATTSATSNRLPSSRPVTTGRISRAAPVNTSTKSAESKINDSTAARKPTRAPSSSLSKSPVNRVLNAASSANRTKSSVGSINPRNAPSTTKSTKQIEATTNAIKSIKTKALVNAGQKNLDNTSASLINTPDGDNDAKLIGLRPGNDFMQAPESGLTQNVMIDNNSDKGENKKEEYDGGDLIISTTKAGNMLADEIAQAEKAAHDTVLKEKLGEEDQSAAPFAGLANQPNLDSSDGFQANASLTKQLVNGIEEGLVSAEDPSELNDRDTSMEPEIHLSKSLEPNDRSYEHEPFSLIPTTYVTEDKDQLLAHNEFADNRVLSDSERAHVNSSSSQSDVSTHLERSDLLVESISDTVDKIQHPNQRVEPLSDTEIIPSNFNREEETPGRKDVPSSDIEPNLHSVGKEQDEPAIPQAGVCGFGNQGDSSIEVGKTILEDSKEESTAIDGLVRAKQNSSSGSSSSDHDFPESKVGAKSDSLHIDFEEDPVSDPEEHLASPQQIQMPSDTVENATPCDTTEHDPDIKNGENLTVAEQKGQDISNEPGSYSDHAIIELKHAHEYLQEQLNVDNHATAQDPEVLHENELDDNSKSDVETSDDGEVIDKGELLMSVAGLETMDHVPFGTAPKSESTRDKSDASSLLAGQQLGELVLSVNQLDEFYAHVSPKQVNENRPAQQVEETNKILNQDSDLSEGNQDVDRVINLNNSELNLSYSEEKDDTVVQPTFSSEKNSTADLLNFGSITPNDEDQSISGIVESHHNTEESQEDGVESKTRDTFNVDHLSSSEDSRRSEASKESLFDSGGDIGIDHPKRSESVTNLESDSNQVTKSNTSAIVDDMDDDEQLKLSNHLTNSDDDVILEPRNRKDSLSGAFSPHRSTSPSRYNEGAGLGIMGQDDEVPGTVEISDGLSAQIDVPTVVESRAEISTSKSLISDVPQASILLHTQKMIQDNVFDDDDEGYDLNPLADPIDVAATMSPSSSVAEEMLQLGRRASLVTAISEMSGHIQEEGEVRQEKEELITQQNDEIEVKDLQKGLGQLGAQSRSDSSSTASSPAPIPVSEGEGISSIDVRSSNVLSDDRACDPSNNNEANNVDTRKHSIDINSDRNNIVEQPTANSQNVPQPAEQLVTTGITVSSEQVGGTHVSEPPTS